MIVTTGGRTDQQTIDHARTLSEAYDSPYIERAKRSIIKLKECYKEDIIVVSRNGIAIHPLSQEEPLTFHPNMAMVRAKRMLSGETDPFIQTAGIAPGMHVLDCTMALPQTASSPVSPLGRKARSQPLKPTPCSTCLQQKDCSPSLPRTRKSMKPCAVLSP